MSRPWMPLYVADYLADTGHLSTVEHGAYMLLIMHYWQKGGLPDDDKRLASIARASLEQWADIRSAVADFFQAGWKHARIDDELEKSAKAYEKRALAGKAGGQAKAAASNARAMLEREAGNALPSTITNTEIEKEEPSGSSKKRGTRIPDDFEPSLADAMAAGLDMNEFGIERLQFLDYWRGKAGAGSTKNDWEATWRVWCRNAVKKRRGQGPPRAGRRNYADVGMDRVNGHGPEGIFGNHGDAQRLPAGSGESRPDDGDIRGGIARRFGSGNH